MWTHVHVHELTFTFAICCRPSLFVCRSVCREAVGAHCVKVHVRYLISWWVLGLFVCYYHITLTSTDPAFIRTRASGYLTLSLYLLSPGLSIASKYGNSVNIVMVALCNRADHYIFALWFLSFFFFFSSPNLSGRRLDVYHTEGATYVRQGDHQVGHWPTF